MMVTEDSVSCIYKLEIHFRRININKMFQDPVQLHHIKNYNFDIILEVRFKDVILFSDD